MRVLLVEDQKDILVGWMKKFKDFGEEFDLLVASSVVEARRMVEQEKVDAALVDMGLPIDSESDDPSETEDKASHGAELLRELEDQYSIPAIALTGTTDPRILRQIDVPLVPKPVKDFEAEIVEALREIGRYLKS